MSSKYRATSGYIWWADVIRDARRADGAWMIAFRNDSIGLVRRIRLRAHRLLVIDDGRLEAKVQHEYVDTDGTRRGDIFVRFVPNEEGS